jgi:uncharacterized protein YcsI (UPF0317 family)
MPITTKSHHVAHKSTLVAVCFILFICVKTTLAFHLQASPFTRKTTSTTFSITPFETSSVAFSSDTTLAAKTSLFTMANPNDDFTVFEPATTVEQKELRAELLLSALPACQPQEGSPANTFTESELQELQAALPNMNINFRPRTVQKEEPVEKNPSKIMDICAGWEAPEPSSIVSTVTTANATAGPQEAPTAGPQEAPSLDWHGAPRFTNPAVQLPRSFRQQVRDGLFTGPTNAQCPGFLQCNLVVLPAGKWAYDFLLFCQRNPKSCPLIDVCDVGSPTPFGIAPDADLRTDCPKYAIYRDGKLEKEVTDVTDVWPEDSVAFLIGCSFSYDGALMDAGIPLRSAEQGKNVPMYKTSLKCRSAGALQGNMVVSMKPIPALSISKEVEITSKYPHAHGGPVCIGRPDVIGIENIDKPEWGDAIDLQPDEVAVFHACGVTPQSVLMDSKVPFAITHSPGYMFVTDMPANMGVV